MAFAHLPFSFRSTFNLFAALLLFMYCVIRGKLEPLDRTMANFEIISLHDFRCYLRVALLCLTVLRGVKLYMPLFGNFILEESTRRL